jgi:hypothetical protein
MNKLLLFTLISLVSCVERIPDEQVNPCEYLGLGIYECLEGDDKYFRYDEY